MPNSALHGSGRRVAGPARRWLALASLGIPNGGCWVDASSGSKPELVVARVGTPDSTHTTAASASLLHVCDDPVALGGGWERCANGLRHRSERGECPSALPRAQAIDPAELQRTYASSTDSSAVLRISRVECQRDSDCTAAPHGYCQVVAADVGEARLECQYGCAADSECAANEVCECGDRFIGFCVATPCAIDADCEGEGMCVIDDSAECRGPQFGCQTARDECATAADCRAGEFCLRDDPGDGAWRCWSAICQAAGQP